MHSTNAKFVDLLRSFTPHTLNVPSYFPHDDTFDARNDVGFDDNVSQQSESSSESGRDIEDDSDDASEVPIQPYSQGVMDFMNDVGNIGDDNAKDFEDNVRVDNWSESTSEIRRGMRFESKKQVKRAVTLWSISKNREFRVLESKDRLWVAQCKSVKRDMPESSDNVHYAPICEWYVRAIKRKTHNMWEITRWVDAHNCFGVCVGNSNRNLNSATISSYILHSIEKDVDYPVKNIQADIKNCLNVDVSYWKAWHGRRKAIETLHGTWESNFSELPKYIAALEASNLTTIVKWFHDPSSTPDALRGARQLPIKACINLTFNRTVQLFRKHSEIAMNCNTPLPSRMWRVFNNRDTHAQSHQFSDFNYTEGVYRIITKLRINGTGGNTHTVRYFQQTCTCGKWQMERFPCSHALAVCRHRGDNPFTIINSVYTTATYRQQYQSNFVPLPHPDYWLPATWKIKADNSKVSTGRGRKHTKRIRNEMDVRHPDEPRRCGLCRQPGHKRNACSNFQPRFNEM